MSMAVDPVTTQASMPDMVQKFVQRFTAMWWQSEADAPDYGPTSTADEQLAREAHLKRFQDTVASEAKRAPRSAVERQATQ